MSPRHDDGRPCQEPAATRNTTAAEPNALVVVTGLIVVKARVGLVLDGLVIPGDADLGLTSEALLAFDFAAEARAEALTLAETATLRLLIALVATGAGPAEASDAGYRLAVELASVVGTTLTAGRAALFGREHLR